MRLFKRTAALILALILCIGALPMTDAASDHPFVDVYDTSAYHDAVVWAYKNKVTTAPTPPTLTPSATAPAGRS